MYSDLLNELIKLKMQAAGRACGRLPPEAAEKLRSMAYALQKSIDENIHYLDGDGLKKDETAGGISNIIIE